MEKESFGDKGKWTSHRKKWQINKDFTGNGVHINIEKRILMHNPKNSWVRFEGVDLIHVYGWTNDEKGRPKLDGEAQDPEL